MTRPLRSVLIALALPLLAAHADSFPLREARELCPRGGLPNTLAKLRAGNTVRIGYLGGSITAAGGWRIQTRTWFAEQYPTATVEEIHAAIGGTGSDLGVYRLQHDALRHKPDLLFVEFAVNDYGASPERIWRGIEGIVRQTRKHDPATDICFVYTISKPMLPDMRNGLLPRSASAMERVADHYAIPSITFGVEVVKREQAGSLVFNAPKSTDGDPLRDAEGRSIFSSDGVHPHGGSGHRLYTDVVARSIEAMAKTGTPGKHALPPPMVADNWEQATLLPLNRATLSAGWKQLDAATHNLAKRFANRMPALWLAEKSGESISLTFEGTALGIYDLVGPDCGKLVCKVDDKPERVVARFDGYCTYHRIQRLQVASGLENGTHRVTISVHADSPDKRKILHDHRRPDFDKNPDKYDGTRWYAGGLLVLGTVKKNPTP